MSDIVVTWPQRDRTLDSYLDELQRACNEGLVINYRVSRLPREEPSRCYVVYEGFVRGWNAVIGMEHRADVTDPTTGRLMAPGFYIVRDPRWHAIEPAAMCGFQGWRYFDREGVKHL